MTNDDARDFAASLGSYGPAAWWFKCDDYESVTLLKEHADAMAAPYGTKPIPLYKAPILTAEECEEISRAIRELESGIAGYDNIYANNKRARANVLRELLKRLGANTRELT